MNVLLEAGPGLDRLVHAEVSKADGAAPAYSTDITTAWELFRKMPRPKRLHMSPDGTHHCLFGGQPAVRPTMSVTLSADHRIVDGAQAAKFLARVVGLLGNPAEMLL